MDSSLYFGEHHHQVREMVRDFSRQEIAPVARELDRTSAFPWENIRKMGELGLLGVPWSEELGGAGMDQLCYYITIHEMAKVDASHALTISAHTNLGTSPIVEFGTPEQKRRYVPLLASGHPRRVRPDRAGSGQRRWRHGHDRGGQGRPLPAQWLEDLHHSRRRG
jgi:butyryl-CoA dehydrogenase